jgi:hypothetical protein
VLNVSYYYNTLHENQLGGDKMMKMGYREGVRVAKLMVIWAKM